MEIETMSEEIWSEKRSAKTGLGWKPFQPVAVPDKSFQ